MTLVQLRNAYIGTGQDGFQKERHSEKFKKYTKEKFDTEVHKVTSYTVNVIKIQRYRHKVDTINGQK